MTNPSTPEGPSASKPEPSTQGFTQEETLWRAATVAAEDTEPPEAVSPEADVAAALAESARRYQLQELLGAGGMGEVRLCRDEAIGREIALKTLLAARSARPSSQKRFLREARVQGQLEHPSVVPVYDLGLTSEGGLFFTMRRVRGHTLSEVLQSLASGDAAHTEGYTRRKLLESFVRVCLAVDYAHQRGVLHRDLKPENIMLGAFGEVYVLDWGIAQLLEKSESGAPLEMGEGSQQSRETVAGTPGYMAPEQILGATELQDARTDVYALGVILYELLTLRPLLTGAPLERCDATLAGVDARPSRLVPEVPPELDAVCVSATSRDRDARPASARALAKAVEGYLDGDRDLELRRELAELHVKRAHAALERARKVLEESPHPGRAECVDAAESARAEATREVIQALALRPEDKAARRLLVELLVEVPSQLPASLEEEIVEASQRARAHTARYSVLAMVGWSLTIPFVAALGVLDWRSFAFASLLTVSSALYSVFLWRKGRVQTGHALGLTTLLAATSAALSCWLGPFVLAPVAGACTVIWATLQASRRERWLLVFISGLGMLAPFALEWLGLVPRSFSFVGGNLVLHPRALAFPPLGTTLCLVYSTVTFSMLQPLLLGGVRDALDAAERRLFVQSWRLRQLAPEPGAGGA